jgi:predicted DNA-binding transcriptional regulator AlpA
MVARAWLQGRGPDPAGRNGDGVAGKPMARDHHSEMKGLIERGIMRAKRYHSTIPFRFGCSAVQAAEAVGVSVNTYIGMVEDGRMPQPKRIGSRKVWDVEEVYAAFKALPHEKQIDEGEPDTWSDLGG